jgi:hypothetical protein
MTLHGWFHFVRCCKNLHRHHLKHTEKTSIEVYGASVAKCLAHLPFTSKAAGSSLSENFPNATRTQSSCGKSKSQRSAESRGFPPGTPVSSNRESRQGGLGKGAHSNPHMLLW